MYSCSHFTDKESEGLKPSDLSKVIHLESSNRDFNSLTLQRLLLGLSNPVHENAITRVHLFIPYFKNITQGINTT